jgi:ankyrin repeat protein
LLIDAASGEKSAEMVALLLERGAKVDPVDDSGMSALMEAALWGRLENVKILLKHGADRALRNHQKRCAVALA